MISPSQIQRLINENVNIMHKCHIAIDNKHIYRPHFISIYRFEMTSPQFNTSTNNFFCRMKVTDILMLDIVSDFKNSIPTIVPQTLQSNVSLRL
jgi:hypothetical protein